ncbi:hypothetical protein ACE6H2_004892 [Prunus campanulata]
MSLLETFFGSFVVVFCCAPMVFTMNYISSISEKLFYITLPKCLPAIMFTSYLTSINILVLSFEAAK